MVSKEEFRKQDYEQLVNFVSDLLKKSDAMAPSMCRSIKVSSPDLYFCLTSKSHKMVWIGKDDLPTSPNSAANSFSRDSRSIFFANKQSSCCGLMRLTGMVLNIRSSGCRGSFFNVISRILIEFYQNRLTNNISMKISY